MRHKVRTFHESVIVRRKTVTDGKYSQEKIIVWIYSMDCHREILAAVKAPKRGFVPLGNKKNRAVGS